MKNSSKEKVARVYSSALYEAAEESGHSEAVKNDVEALGVFCQNNRDLLIKSASPLLSEEDQKEMWREVGRQMKLDKETVRFLEILVDNNRISDMSAVLRDFICLYYEKNNIAEVWVETVKKLSAAQDKRLKAVLQRKLGKDIVVKYINNPSLLGGLRVQSGSKMFDGSLSHKLNCIENVMKGK